VAFEELLGKMGAHVVWYEEGVTVTGPAEGTLRGIELDMNHIPDMVQTLCVVALFAQGATTVTNVWNLRVKETDRLAALETELRKLGATVETGKDWIRVTPPSSVGLKGASIATYDDHRMAMAFAVAGLRVPGIRIQDPRCTGKTYPEYFEDLRGAVGGS
jgi:3-phosphoshikimate 1-carboxyvinyltransferase